MRAFAILVAFVATTLFAADKADGVSPEDAKFSAGKETKILDPETGGVGWYVVYVPKDYKPDRECPLIFCYHGKNNDPKSWPFKELTDGSGYIVVGMEYKDHENPNAAVDVENLKRIRKYLEPKLKINPKLVFMGGFSQGGWSTSSFSNLYIDNLAGLIILGAGGQPGDRTTKRIKDLPVFVGAGENDQYNKNAKEARDAYKAKGAAVVYEEFPGLGHSVDTKDKVLKEWLLKQGPQNQLMAVLKNAHLAEQAGNLGAAYTLYASAGKMSGGEDADAAAKKIAEAAEKKMAEAEADVTAKKYDAAVKLLKSIAVTYAGSELAEKATARAMQIQSDPAIKADIVQTALDAKADALEAQALNSEKSKDFAKALDAFESYSKQFTKATRFTAVQTHYAELKSDPKVQAAAKQQFADRDCRKWMTLADNYIRSNLPGEAKPYLQMILDQYGNSEYAAEAKKKLAALK